MDEKEQVTQEREVPTGADASQEKDVSQEQSPRDADQQVQDIAIAIGVDPSQISKRKDITEMLERMKEGVTVSVSISRPRFWSKLTLEDLGLAVGSQLAVSEAANQVLNDYFRLGRRSLLPKDYQDRLNLIDTSVRQNVNRNSFKSHWGAFVPLTMYERWKEENTRLEQEFWALRDVIINNYDSITDQVVEASRPLAEDAWRRITLGTVQKLDDDALTREVIEGVIERLRAGDGRDHFVENYLNSIRMAMPLRSKVENDFGFEVEISIVPLPSLLAQDMENSDRIYRERAIKDAKTRAELERIESERRAEQQKLSLDQQIENELRYQRLQQERERQRLQWEMERDVLSNARRQKERLVQEFYTGIVRQVNELINGVATNILDSLDEHNGIIRGRVSVQLGNLVKQLKQLNFVDDRQVEDQIARLQAILPTQDEKDQAKKGLAKIDTTRISKVVQAINDEASKILVDLGTQPRTRKTREQPLSTAQPMDLDAERRKKRPVLPEPGEAFSSPLNDTETSAGRRTKRPL